MFQSKNTSKKRNPNKQFCFLSMAHGFCKGCLISNLPHLCPWQHVVRWRVHPERARRLENFSESELKRRRLKMAPSNASEPNTKKKKQTFSELRYGAAAMLAAFGRSLMLWRVGCCHKDVTRVAKNTCRLTETTCQEPCSPQPLGTTSGAAAISSTWQLGQDSPKMTSS